MNNKKTYIIKILFYLIIFLTVMPQTDIIYASNNIKLLNEYCLYPQKLMDLIDIDKFKKNPEFTLITQLFKNNITDTANNEPGYFGIDFKEPVIINMITTGINKMPDIIIKLKIDEFDKFNLSVQFLSAQKYSVEEYDSKQNIYFFKKSESDSLISCYPALYKNGYFYLLIDALSANAEFSNFKGKPADYYSSEYRINRAIEVFAEIIYKTDFFLDSELKEKNIQINENVLFYLFNKLPLPFLSELYGLKSHEKKLNGEYIKTLSIAEITQKSIKYSNYDLSPVKIEDAFYQNKIIYDEPIYNLITGDMLIFCTSKINKKTIKTFRENSDIQIPGLNYFINNITELLEGHFIFCCQSNNNNIKNDSPVINTDNETNNIFNIFTPILLFDISNKNHFIEILTELGNVFPEKFKIDKTFELKESYKIIFNTGFGKIENFMKLIEIENKTFVILSSNKNSIEEMLVKYYTRNKKNYFLMHLIEKNINFTEINGSYYYFDIKTILQKISNSNNNLIELNPVQKDLLNYFSDRVQTLSGYKIYKKKVNLWNLEILLSDKLSFADLYALIKKNVLSKN